MLPTLEHKFYPQSLLFLAINNNVTLITLPRIKGQVSLSKPQLSLLQIFQIERLGRVVDVPLSYSAGPVFKYRSS